MDVIAGLGAVSNALTIAKALRKIDKDYDSAVLRAQLADLIDQLTDAKISLTEAKDQLSIKDNEISRLKEQQITIKSLLHGDGDYSYLTNEKGERTGFPCCPRCLEVDSRTIQIKMNVNVDSAKCPVCSSEYRPVTCYIPASENGGKETTKVEQYRETRKRQHEEQSARFSALNSDSWLSR